MEKYNFQLTQEDVDLIRYALVNYGLGLIEKNKKESNEQKFLSRQQVHTRANNIYNSLCFQLSDQKKPYTPMSQRTYPE